MHYYYPGYLTSTNKFEFSMSPSSIPPRLPLTQEQGQLLDSLARDVRAGGSWVVNRDRQGRDDADIITDSPALLAGLKAAGIPAISRKWNNLPTVVIQNAHFGKITPEAIQVASQAIKDYESKAGLSMAPQGGLLANLLRTGTAFGQSLANRL
jgi:hypothetical protein